MHRRTENVIFIFGWIALGLGIVGALLLRMGVFDWIHGTQLCAFRRLTGYYCPGCGITRATFALAKGNVIKSILYHPAPVYALALFLVWMCRTAAVRIRGKNNGAFPAKQTARFNRRMELAIYAGIGIVIAQWLVKLALQILAQTDWFTWVDLF